MSQTPPIIFNLTDNRFEFPDVSATAQELRDLSDQVNTSASMEQGLALTQEVNRSCLVFDEHAEDTPPLWPEGGPVAKLRGWMRIRLWMLRDGVLKMWRRQNDFNSQVTRALNTILSQSLAPLIDAVSRQQAFNRRMIDLIQRFDTRKMIELISYLDRKDEGLKLGIRRLEDWFHELERNQSGLARNLEQVVGELRDSHQFSLAHADTVDRQVALLERSVRYFRQRVDEMLLALKSDEPRPKAAARVKQSLADDAYYIHQERFRGPEPLIRERLSVYAGVFEGCERVLDIGCGRGEFLSLLAGKGIPGHGIDHSRRMVEVCREKGLSAEQGDLFEVLEASKPGVVDGIFCSQVVEHLTGDDILRCLRLMDRALAPNGRLVIETQNASSVYSLTQNFTQDLDHETPIHPQALKHTLEDMGYEARLEFLHPVEDHKRLRRVDLKGSNLDPMLIEQINRNFDILDRLIFGDQDFAVVGRKA